MKLTGKCDIAFNKWNYENDFGYIYHEPMSLVVHFEDLDENLRNTIIIDFFDSIKCAGFKSLWSYAFGNSYDPFSDNWNEYIGKAIEQANLIYNKMV